MIMSSTMSKLPHALGLAAGVALDALLGDPRRGHPVAAFGRAAAALEQRDYADSRARGLAHVAVCVGAVAAPAALLQRRLRGRPLLEFTAVAATAWAVTGARSLRHISERAVVALTEDDLPAAREVLPSLCGRDPSGLGSKEIARAVIESVAENTSDAVVAPLLWGAAAGLPGLVAYRAINTLDAMIGHHSPRYERFGWAAARLDDVANWIPSRVTALLAVACSPTRASTPTRACAPSRAPHRVNCAVEPTRACQRGDSTAALDAWRAWRRYGAQHPSPNAGQCESAFAGALGVRLGGTNVYHGVPETRPELGDGRPPEPADVRHAIRLSRNISIAAAALAALAATAKARLR